MFDLKKLVMQLTGAIVEQEGLLYWTEPKKLDKNSFTLLSRSNCFIVRYSLPMDCNKDFRI